MSRTASASTATALPSAVRTCRICSQTAAAPLYAPREMMHGTRDVFEYFQCPACRCLQISTIPPDLHRYYSASDYYSLKGRSPFARFLLQKRTDFLAGKSTLIGRLVTRLRPPETGANPLFRGAPLNSRILEVGAGRGILIRKLFERGYRNLTGIDPFLAETDRREAPFRLQKAAIEDLDSNASFDFILFDHSLEHIPNQQQTLASARRLIAPGGQLILRIPFVDSYAWETYGTDWVQLDAPRHLYLHSNQSLHTLAALTQWRVDAIIHDAYSFQFWGSEQYKRDIPLRAPNSWHVNAAKSPFTLAEIESFQHRSDELNRLQRGDQVSAYLTPL